MTSNTLACMENLRCDLSRPLSTEIWDDNAYFGEQDAMAFGPCSWYAWITSYDADMQTRAMRSCLAAKGDDNCAFLIDPHLLRRERTSRGNKEVLGTQHTQEQARFSKKTNSKLAATMGVKIVSTRNRTASHSNGTDSMTYNIKNAVKNVNQTQNPTKTRRTTMTRIMLGVLPRHRSASTQ